MHPTGPRGGCRLSTRNTRPIEAGLMTGGLTTSTIPPRPHEDRTGSCGGGTLRTGALPSTEMTRDPRTRTETTRESSVTGVRPRGDTWDSRRGGPGPETFRKRFFGVGRWVPVTRVTRKTRKRTTDGKKLKKEKCLFHILTTSV